MTRLTVPLMAGLVICAAVKPAPAVVLQPALGPTAIPFELVNRHVLVRGTVNGSRPLWFVLDTGANVAIVRMATAEKLGLSLEGNVNTGGAGSGTQAGRFVRRATWSLVGLAGFSQPVSVALPLPALPSGLGHDVDGIIGGEFIRQFVLELDYQARSITLHDPRSFRYSGNGQTLPLEFTANNHPVLKAMVTPVGGKPIEHRFHLDIGSGLALALHSPFVAEHNLPGRESTTIRAIGLAGAGGQSIGRIGRVAALQIGSFVVRNPITVFSEDKGGAFADRSLAGNIGAQIANRFRTILDYSRRRIILEPSPAFDDPFDRAFSGMAVRAEGPDYRIFRVREVLENSPASEAGIEEGDIIAAVNDLAADRLTFTALTEILEKPVPHELTIRRADRILEITITPRMLVSRERHGESFTPPPASWLWSHSSPARVAKGLA